MKFRKKQQLLQGITAIRVKLGLTQPALAQYLGVSKSLVSMVENGRRTFPLAALLKLSELEIQFQEAKFSERPFQLPAYTESATEKASRQLKESIKRSELTQLEYRLKMMVLEQEETLISLKYLEAMQATATALTFNLLELDRTKLLKRLKRSDETVQAAIRGRIAMLEIVLERYEQKNRLMDAVPVTGPASEVDSLQGQSVNAGSDILSMSIGKRMPLQFWKMEAKDVVGWYVLGGRGVGRVA